jgi:hypothetical protein
MNWTTPEIRNEEFQAEMTAGCICGCHGGAGAGSGISAN